MTRRTPTVPVRAIVIISLVVLAVFLLASAVQATGAPAATEDYQVRAGDTLWSIADEHTDAGGDVRSTVGMIRSLNQLEGSTIYAGQILELPADG